MQVSYWLKNLYTHRLLHYDNLVSSLLFLWLYSLNSSVNAIKLLVVFLTWVH